ncbi:MAG: porin family protein [Schleiferiaceae bacterium]|nr:porin family protein [Schleiferiaceae bacterium]
MKKITLILGLVVGTYTAQAQLEKGSLLLSGDIGFNSSTGKMEITSGGNTVTQADPKFTDFNLNLQGGYFVADNFAVGLGIGYGLSKITEDGDDFLDEISTGIFAINPFARYYIPYTNKFAFFAQLDLGIGFGSTKTESRMGNTTITDEGSVNVFGIGVSPGFTYFLTESIGLDLRVGFLGYNSASTSFESNNSTTTNSISGTGVNIGLNSLTFGLSVFLD